MISIASFLHWPCECNMISIALFALVMRVSMLRVTASWRAHRNVALDVQLLRCIPFTRTKGFKEHNLITNLWRPSQIYEDVQSNMISIAFVFHWPWEFQCCASRLLGVRIVTSRWMYNCYVHPFHENRRFNEHNLIINLLKPSRIYKNIPSTMISIASFLHWPWECNMISIALFALVMRVLMLRVTAS